MTVMVLRMGYQKEKKPYQALTLKVLRMGYTAQESELASVVSDVICLPPFVGFQLVSLSCPRNLEI